MSYLVLARKSRPQTFDEVVGQRPVVKTLQNSLRRGRVAHAILFSGVRGVGKTTLARLMAKAINCTGETESPPCNTCQSCREITAGSSFDLHEIDGASNRGIQEIRELKDKIRFLPTSSRCKIIIIDEVHMLTTEAFNALLKTLEEPPAHVYFMFATTELHKIPITILSRCQQYELKRVPASELSAHFQRLTLSEGFTIEPAALALIVREAEGSVRDGLSLLDQIFSFGEKQIRREDVVEVLGLVDREVLMRLTVGLLGGDRAAALLALDEIFAFGVDLRRFSTDLLTCFRNLILTRIEGCESLLDLPEHEAALFKETARRYSLETLHMQLNLLMEAVEEIRYSVQPRLALETAFLKIIEAGNVVPVTTLLAHLEVILRKDQDDPAARGEAPPPPENRQPTRTQPPPIRPELSRRLHPRKNLKRPHRRTSRQSRKSPPQRNSPNRSRPALYCRPRQKTWRFAPMNGTSAGTGLILSGMCRSKRCGWPRICSGPIRSSRSTRNCTSITAIPPTAPSCGRRKTASSSTNIFLIFFKKISRYDLSFPINRTAWKRQAPTPRKARDSNLPMTRWSS